MNILLINHYAGSPKMGMEYRPYYLAREWINDGHKVYIIAASQSHVRTNQPNVRNDFQEKIIDGINYIWIKTFAYKGNSFGRIKNMFDFTRKLWFNSKKIAKKYQPDVVIASSTYPLDNYPARRISKFAKAKYIYEVHDLWPLSPMELGGYSKWHPFIIIMQRAENFAYKNIDAVVSMLPKTISHMVSHGLNPEKFNYIPNGICPDEWNENNKIPEKHKSILENIQKEGNKIIAYTGSHGIANALDNFINAAEILKNKKISFVLIGKGPEKENLKKLTQSKELNNVIFLDSISKNEIPDLLSYFDILYIGLKHQPLFRFGISPNKMIDYMMAGKPIIQAINAGNNMVEEANCGISVTPDTPDETAEAIIKLINLSDGERKIIGEKGRKYILKNHNYTKLAEQFINILSK
ncbi:MAG: glycosyltransferase family 4 protein [Bacteroidales bacterium]|nr:glycosyltransferase family 4 protein [Bacteroidales bacterium]